MAEVSVLDQDLNGLGWTIKSLMDQNLAREDVHKIAAKLRGSLVVTESESDVSVTLVYGQRGVSIQNGAQPRPTATLQGDFEGLSQVISGQTGPIKAVLTGKIRAGGNLFKLLTMAKTLISRETS